MLERGELQKKKKERTKKRGQVQKEKIKVKICLHVLVHCKVEIVLSISIDDHSNSDLGGGGGEKKRKRKVHCEYFRKRIQQHQVFSVVFFLFHNFFPSESEQDFTEGCLRWFDERNNFKKGKNIFVLVIEYKWAKMLNNFIKTSYFKETRTVCIKKRNF